MLQIFLFLIPFSKLTIDWPSHKIEPIVAVFYLHDLDLTIIVSINKFQQNFAKQELNLLLWCFEIKIDINNINNVDENLTLLENSKRCRFEFCDKAAFSGKNVLTKNKFAGVETTIKVKDNYFQFFFQSFKTSEGNNLAKLVGYFYNNTISSIFALTEKENALFEYIKTLENRRKRNRTVKVALILISIFLLGIAGVYFYWYKSLK